MSIKISIPVLEASYDLLRSTEPFNRWKLPAAESISFRVSAGKIHAGWFFVDAAGTPWIVISYKRHHTLPEILKTIAHEMCHLRQHICGDKNINDGIEFLALAAKVCKAHQFDLGAF